MKVIGMETNILARMNCLTKIKFKNIPDPLRMESL